MEEVQEPSSKQPANMSLGAQCNKEAREPSAHERLQRRLLEAHEKLVFELHKIAKLSREFHWASERECELILKTLDAVYLGR